VIIRNLTFTDWPQVQAIYESGIATGHATFEMQSPDWENWDKNRLPFCRLVACEDKKVWAWAALSPVSSRAVYSGVAEVSIYICAESRGKGIGNILLEDLITESENNGIWTLQAGIFPENKASIKLHQGAGFRIIGYREKIGKMHGLWRDTVQLERRSTVVGID
jgi:L-amino acid N-acyltransferase YncA